MNKNVYHIINSLLAGGLVFFGAFTTGKITWEAVVIALMASAVVAITKFKDYWENNEKEARKYALFNFV